MTSPETNSPSRLAAMARGFRNRCPACGESHLFRGFLKVADRCEACGTELHHHRADDLPPYLVIFVVGHLIGYGILTAETRFDTPLWVHLALWPALTILLALLLLQPVKGAVVGLQYALGMHGFGEARDPMGEKHSEGQKSAGDHRPAHLDGA